MTETIKQRNEIPQNFRWDIEDMYQSREQWSKDLEEVLTLADKYATFEGRLTENAQTFFESLTLKDQIWQKLERCFVYARMKRDEDNRVDTYQALCDLAMTAVAKVNAITSFSTPELLATDEKKIFNFFDELPQLEIYRFAIMDILRLASHVLSKEEENILAQMSQLLSATNDIFTMLNNADMEFGTIFGDGLSEEPITLTHGNYIKFMENPNREIRKEAYETMYRQYKRLINTLATSYSYNTKTDVVSSNIRKYTSARSAALASDNIPDQVYDNLINVVNSNLPILHKYMDIRKKLLGLDTLQMYDVYVPLISTTPREIPYEEALEIMKDGLSALGEDYINRLSKGLSNGWVDVYENQGKTSGAYSFGSYDSKPYVLLNYTNTLKDVFTLAHEMGHSMHSLYTRETQPFVYGGHSIFTAEVASTVNENLLLKHLLAKETDHTMKKYLLNLHIEEFRTTLFRQTMFAEFEHMTHAAIEDGQSLTSIWLCNTYDQLNKKYFGEALASDPFIQYEWARIPHFYNAFYVYKYATGYSAAAAISDKIIKDGAKDYISFLRSGESNHPIELLKLAGVDMATPEPIKAAMSTFKTLVEDFEKLCFC